MVVIEKIVYNGTNSYLIISGDRACLIDVSAPLSMVEKFLKNVKLEYILITHAHMRHIQYLREFRSSINCKICIHKNEVTDFVKVFPDIEPDLKLKHMQDVKITPIEITVYHTPGHTEGSVCFEIRSLKALFTGDTLLKDGFGKIRSPQDMQKIVISLKMLSRSIPPETRIYPGHGEETVMGREVWLDGLDMLS
ncbi:MAG: MBL fold metallo-hydrolase [Nitrososphaerota archaeon]|nr:MBL fold metallo-hydrolase [Candidatus Geocrenenecus dongiae]